MSTEGTVFMKSAIVLFSKLCLENISENKWRWQSSSQSWSRKMTGKYPQHIFLRHKFIISIWYKYIFRKFRKYPSARFVIRLDGINKRKKKKEKKFKGQIFRQPFWEYNFFLINCHSWVQNNYLRTHTRYSYIFEKKWEIQMVFRGLYSPYMS